MNPVKNLLPLKNLAEHPDADGHYPWMVDFVYGGIDGAVTTFAVVAGVAGAHLSVPTILILGFANLFADGFSMASGKYSSDKAEIEQYERIRQIEYRHLKDKTEHERQEVVEILQTYGFKGEDLVNATRVITSNPDAWVDLMMRHEFNMTLENVKPMQGALTTFFAFLTIGFIPLIGYTFKAFLPLHPDQIFLATCVMTFIALFIVGAVKSRFIIRHWLLAGLETALIGSLAATVAYLVGFFLRGLA
jgi:VIT1/CCC1 family predicted Fe2+/Mn2+ transporter